MTWIATYRGRRFDLLDPRPEMIHIEDIAHALAMTCRFGGHSRDFYSVAQHSVAVAERCCPEHYMHGLLHDASEAYYGDVVRPLKALCGDYHLHEKRAQVVIYQKFGLDPNLTCSCVKAADEVCLATEGAQLVSPVGVESWGLEAEPDFSEFLVPMTWQAAERLFMYRYEQALEGVMEFRFRPHTDARIHPMPFKGRPSEPGRFS